MANLNKTVVIQLLNAGIYDLITEFDVEHEYWSNGCSTCGSIEYDCLIHYVKVMSTAGEKVIEIANDTIGFPDDEEILALKDKTAITQSELTRLILNYENLEMFKAMTLEQFHEWLSMELTLLVAGKWEAYYEE